MDPISFVGGMAYGATSVVIGQPWDTVKTLKQTSHPHASSLTIAKELVHKEGIRGLYRGAVPPLIGGTLFRSAQFGFYENTKKLLEAHSTDWRIGGVVSWHVAVAGAAGGVGRGLLEAFFDHIKVRRQVQQPWGVRSLIFDSALSVTLTRNIGLFGLFVIYLDLTKASIEATGMSPGAAAVVQGSVCSSLAWLSIWPLDVVKSRCQSGIKAHNMNFVKALQGAARDGSLYRGLVPGLVRSALANGPSMYMLKLTERTLRQWSSPLPPSKT